MMSPLTAISDRAGEIQENPPAGGAVPGLREQYAEQAARLKEGAANAEFVTIPGFLGAPSKMVLAAPRNTIAKLPSIPVDPPTSGAKHITINTMLNRPFSRGTIVSRIPPIAIFAGA